MYVYSSIITHILVCVTNVILIQIILYKWLILVIINYGKVNLMASFLNSNINQLKLEVQDTYKKDEKITINFEPADDSDIINKGYLDDILLKINGHSSKLEKDYNEVKLQYNKQSVEEILIQRAVKTMIQILYDKGLFDKYANADKVLEAFSFTTRRRSDLEEVNDNVQ